MVLVMVLGCQMDDETPLVRPAVESRMIVSGEDIPEVTSKLLTKLGLGNDAKLFSANSGTASNLEIDWERVMQLVDTTGQKTYTFAIKDRNDDPSSFYNLVMKYSALGDAHEPFLMKYTMAEDFISEYLESGSLENFRGTVKKVSLTRSQTGKGTYSSAGPSEERGGATAEDDSCPGTTVGSGGNDGGGDTPPDSNDPPDTGGVSCTTYIVTNTWYSQACGGGTCEEPIVTGRNSSVVTVCQREGDTGEEGGEGENDCDPDEGEIPILNPDFSRLANLWEIEICEKENFTNNTCVKEIWDEMNKGNVGYQAVSKFSGESPVAKLCLDIKSLPTTVNGNTGVSGSVSNATVTINVNSQNLYRSKLGIARTLIHELFHAELTALVIQAGWYPELEEYSKNYTGSDPFAAVWKYFKDYGRYKPGVRPGWQHEYMADKYVDAISKGLKGLAPNLLSSRFIDYIDDNQMNTLGGDPIDWEWDSLYEAMAWGGLKETDEYKALPEATKTKYDEYVRILDEYEVQAGKCN